MENQNNTPAPKKKTANPIDFGKLFKCLLGHKRLYIKVLAATFVVGCIYTLSLHNYFQCTVKLAPELTGSTESGSLASLASTFGVSLESGALGSDAIYPTLYPELMNSVDFKTSLFPIKVRKDNSNEEYTYYEYLKAHRKSTWWSKGISSFLSLFSSNDSLSRKTTVDPFRLTKKQTEIVSAIDGLVTCQVDKKTMVITIGVTDQDPLIAATIADSVRMRLQTFITDYRTNKSRIDLEYAKKITAEAKHRYDKARRLYAEFSDANQDILLESVRQHQTELENDMQLQYNAYSQMAGQLLAAEARVQEQTPAFTVLQSATVPVKKAGPGRAKIVLALLFLAFIATTTWILYKEKQLLPLLGF